MSHTRHCNCSNSPSNKVIDDVSRDEPFTVSVKGRPFAVIPYTLHLNDIVNFEERHFSADQFASELKYEFDALYEESATRRRMMSISTHDRIAGRPARVKVFEEFISYAQSKPGVKFLLDPLPPLEKGGFRTQAEIAIL